MTDYNTDNLHPHQLRVIEEKRDLDIKLAALTSFINSEVFMSLPDAEHFRLGRQLDIMSMYSAVLGERIAAF